MIIIVKFLMQTLALETSWEERDFDDGTLNEDITRTM